MGGGRAREALAKVAKVYCHLGVVVFFAALALVVQLLIGTMGVGGLTVRFIPCLPTLGALMRLLSLGLRMLPDPETMTFPFFFLLLLSLGQFGPRLLPNSPPN